MNGSIRWKVALTAGGLSSLLVATFALVSAAWFYHEQLDAMDGEASAAHSAQHIAQAREEVGELAVAYLLAIPIVAAVAAFGTWWLAGRLTRPLTILSNAAEQIDARSLHERLPEPCSNDEIARLTHVLNNLLSRLEKSFALASRFTADASHELRTPLAIMRATIEEGIQCDPSGPQSQRLVSLLEENQRLAAISDKLLMLARADAGNLLADSQSVNLSEVVEEIASDFSAICSDRNLKLESDISPNIAVRGDKHLLRHLLLNLFDNALTHNQENGWIRASLILSGKSSIFTIANSGKQIDEISQNRLFERFFRAELSRERVRGGAGLGLSLCREIVAAHNGSLALVTSVTENTTFQFVMPAEEHKILKSGDDLRRKNHSP